MGLCQNGFILFLSVISCACNKHRQTLLLPFHQNSRSFETQLTVEYVKILWHASLWRSRMHFCTFFPDYSAEGTPSLAHVFYYVRFYTELLNKSSHFYYVSPYITMQKFQWKHYVFISFCLSGYFQKWLTVWSGVILGDLLKQWRAEIICYSKYLEVVRQIRLILWPQTM